MKKTAKDQIYDIIGLYPNGATVDDVLSNFVNANRGTIQRYISFLLKENKIIGKEIDAHDKSKLGWNNTGLLSWRRKKYFIVEKDVTNENA